ncbi:MAG: AsmA family protein [Halioglobus sp.]
MIFFLALIALTGITLFSLDFGRFKPQVESFASDVLNRPLTIAGPLHFTVGLREGAKLSVENLTLAGADWNSSAELLHLDKFEVAVAIASLTQSPLIIDSVMIDGLHVQLEKDDQGRKNWQFFESEDAVEQDEITDQKRFRMPVWPAEVSVTNSSISYITQGQSQPLVLDVATLTEEVLPSQQVSISFGGALNQRSMALTIQSQTLDSLISFEQVELKIAGQLGKLQLSGNLSTDDLLAPYQPTANLAFTSPAIEGIFETLGIEPITSGPLDLQLSLVPQLHGVDLALTGALGEFNVGTHGKISDFQKLEKVELEFTADGPDAGGLTNLFVPGLLPNDPFTLSGKISRSGEQFGVEAFSAKVNQSSLTVDGQISNFPHFDGAEVVLQLDIPDTRRFSDLLAVPGKLEGPLLVNVNLQSASTGESAILKSSAVLNDMVLHIDGTLSDEETLVGSRFLISFEESSVQSLLQIMDMQTTSTAPVSLEAQLERSVDGIKIISADVTLGADKLSVTGTVGTVSPGITTDLKASLSGPQLAQTFTVFAAGADQRFKGLMRPYSLSADIGIEDDILSVANAEFEIDKTRLKLDGNVGLKPALEQGVIILEARSENILPLAPKVSQNASHETMPLSLDSSIHWENNLWSIERLEMLLGNASLDIAGTIDGPPDFGKTSLKLEATVVSLAALGKVVGQELPDVPVSARGNFSGKGTTLAFNAFAAQVGASDLRGDASYQYGDKPKIVVSLRSDKLDLNPFLPSPTADSPDTPTAGVDKKPVKRAGSTKGRERVIPDSELPLALLKTFDADIDLKIQQIIAWAKTVENVVIRGSVIEGAVHLKQASLTTPRGGNLEVLATLDPTLKGAEIGLRVKGHSLTMGLPADNEKDVEQLPVYSLNLAANGEGSTVRDLTDGLNGYLRVVASEGRIKTGEARLLTNDFLAELMSAVNPYSSQEPYADIRCVTVLAAAEAGRVYGDPVLVLQTDKLHIFAKTEVKLKKEKLDLYFKTVPQRGLGISLTNLINPYVKVTGTFAQPALSLDGESAFAHGSAAILTGGLSILATSIVDRYSSPKDPCGQSLVEGNAGLLELEKKYARGAAPQGWVPVD